MNIEPGNYVELKLLIDAMCDNSITDDQVSQLEQLIAADEKALEFYIQYMWMSDDVERISSEYFSKIDMTKFDGIPADLENVSKQIQTIEDDEMVTAASRQPAWNSVEKLAQVGHRPFNWQAAKMYGVVAGLVFVGLTVAYMALFSNRGENSAFVVEKIATKSLERKELADGTIVIARANTKYKIEDRRQILLEQGDLYLIVAKSSTPFIVKTADGEIHATGTRFTVSATDKTEAAVAQGRVVLFSSQGDIELGVGQKGILIKDDPPTRGPAQRLSYLVNWAKDALKQDEPLVQVGQRENGLIAIDPYGQEARLSLRQYNVDVYIEDGIARTTIDQTFFNHNPWNTEGTFYFPLPPDASVSRLAMYVNGELNEGGMVSRERGQEIYTEILYQRRDPALLEMMEGNMFKMRIFPLEGRQEKRIFLSYTQDLEELYGTSKYWFPMDHTQDIANSLTIRVHIKDGAKLFDPQSSTHDLKVSVEGDDLVMEYAAEKIKPDQDFLLNMIPRKSDRRQAGEARVAVCELNGQRYVSAKLRPDLTGDHDPEPRQWIVLNDVSASRSYLDIRTQQYILKRLITEADDEDSVFLIDLNTTARSISTQPLNVRSADVERLLDHRPQRLIGATNVEAGLKAAGDTIKKFDMTNPYLIYLGDGVATDGEKKISELPRLIPPRCKFVGVGVGKKVDSMFLQEAANQTGGAYTTINPNEDIDWRVFDLLALLNTPRLTNIQVDLLDQDDQLMESIAYPSSRLLAAGETMTVTAMCGEKLPSQIRFRGRIGAKAFTRTARVESAKKGAQYLPRLWAKRHIDELLKSNMSSKEEIIALSKDFYVVTPHTSLIVLEDDAMYEEYGVERGRKDHWAKYDAPKQIEVVQEPVDWNRWGWGGWRNFQGEESKIDVNTRPKTVQEIVDNIQIRVNAPFYLWQGSARDSRTGLYWLCEDAIKPETDPARWLTLWFLLSANDRQTVVDWRRDTVSEPEGATGSGAKGDRLQKAAKLRQLRQSLYYRNLQAILPGSVRPSDSLSGVDRLFGGGGFGGRGFRGGQLMGESRFLFESHGRSSMALFRFQRERLSKRQLLASRISEFEMSIQSQLQGLSSLRGETHQSGLVGDLDPKLNRTFNEAIATRQKRLNRDIQKFNSQLGYWRQDQWNVWNDIDLRRTANTDLFGSGLIDLFGSAFVDFDIEFDGDGLLDIADMEDDEEDYWLPGFELSSGFRGISDLLVPNDTFGYEWLPASDGYVAMRRGEFFKVPQSLEFGKRMRASTFLAVSQQPVGTQPGLASILAADHLHSRLSELNNAVLDNRTSAEKTAIEIALSKMERVGANLEPNELFWGHAGWQYQPRPKTVQLPTIQAYQGYRWSFDLTRYAYGLYSDKLDMLDEVTRQYGKTKLAGSIDDRARTLIDATRAKFKPVVVSYGENGSKIQVGPNDQFATSSQSAMYLTERIICDGSNIFQIYDELGIASRRDVSEIRMSMLRKTAPHVLESADTLIQQFDVELVENDEQSFTLKLTPAQPEVPVSDLSASNEKPEKIEFDSHLLIEVDHEGRTLKRQLINADDPVCTISFRYVNDKVELKWEVNGKTENANGIESYVAKRFDATSETFAVNQDPLVVFDMPLKKASFYTQKMQEFANRQRKANGENIDPEADQKPDLAKMNFLDEDLPEVIELNRHLALAQIQDFRLATWGYIDPNVPSSFLLRTLAMQKRIGGVAKKGDLALFGSWGGRPKAIASLPDDLSGSSLGHFFDLRGDWSESEKKFKAETGLIGHLSAYRVAALSHRQSLYQSFRTRFKASPLTLALLQNHATKFRLEELIKLNQEPRWSGTALFTAASQCSTEEDIKRLAEGFWKWEQDLTERKMIPIVSSTLINLIRPIDGKRLSGLFAKQLESVQKLDSVTLLLTFAEQLSASGEIMLADRAYDDAYKRLGLDDKENEPTLLKRFAYAQALWAGNRYRQAFEEYQTILSTLKSKEVPLSPAFLAATARLANQAGNLDQAIEFEEKAMELEQPYLPDAINLSAFRQRYQWLWSRYTEQIKAVAKDDPERESKIEELMNRATKTWDRWMEVDRDNASLPMQMATLLKSAGREDQSWEFLSSLIDQKPKDANSYSMVGEWFRQQGNKAATVRWLGEAPQWDTANPQWIFQYGKALKELGRSKEANVQFNKVVNGKWAPGLQRWIARAKAEIQ